MPDGTTARADLTLASSLETINRLEETALEFAQSAGFDATVAGNLAMVVREAAANAVIHGNHYDPELPVEAHFELSAEALTIRVADHGPGLDPSQLPDPLAPENLLRSSGRGVFLMRAFMDDVQIRPREPAPGRSAPGCEITLIKYRPGHS